MRWGSALMNLNRSSAATSANSNTTLRRAARNRPARSLTNCCPVAQARVPSYASALNRISEQNSCRARSVAPPAARSSPGMSRSEGRSEEEDVFVGAIRPCSARESKSQISSPSGPKTVATTPRSSNRGGHDSTNANERSTPGSTPSSSEPALIIPTAASPRTSDFRGIGWVSFACANWRAHQALAEPPSCPVPFYVPRHHVPPDGTNVIVFLSTVFGLQDRTQVSPYATR